MKHFALRIIPLTVGLILFSQCFTHAWNYAGHRIIASIAYDQLDPSTQTAMLELLKQHPRFEQDFQSRMPDVIKNASPEIQNRWIFMRAATWPDLARSFNDANREKYHHGTWHYINQPIYLDSASEQVLSRALTANVATSIKEGDDPLLFNILQALEYCVKKMKDPAVSKADKAVYLCWIMHLTGDSHQPLHSSALFSKKTFPEGDRGGNSIRIGKSNLHSQWDGLLGNSFKYSDIVGHAVGIARNPAMKQLGEKATQQMNFSAWINESHELAREKAYCPEILEAARKSEAADGKFQKLSALPPSYYQQAGTIAAKRAAQSGWRLAELIKNVQ
ncbi:S1/P1 Nuclease [Gimesia alba]|uniref:S1/P1 Nuclease n=1 Tax=Gimesia alba TaxID=2527973 RepID=A0A517RH72_9PLAN|nr:S1/P1 nuclease [Gimesia alba]QDT43224.1 S1/P1 Nuclease [Gimesia alba]